MNNFINFSVIVLLLLKLTSQVVLTVIVVPWEDTGWYISIIDDDLYKPIKFDMMWFLPVWNGSNQTNFPFGLNSSNPNFRPLTDEEWRVS